MTDTSSAYSTAGQFPIGTELPTKEWTCVNGCGREPWRAHSFLERKGCPGCGGANRWENGVRDGGKEKLTGS